MNSVVYMVQALDGGQIKIGTSTNLKRRLATLDMGLPGGCELLCAVDGGLELERQYHSRFADHRISGEWFKPVGPILAEVERIHVGGLNVDPETQSGDVDEKRRELLDRACILIRHCAAPGSWDEPTPQAIARAARNLDMSVGRVTSIWYAKARTIAAEEWQAIRECALERTEDPELLREELRRVVREMRAMERSINRMSGGGKR